MANRSSSSLLRYLNDNRLWLMLMILAVLAAVVFTGIGRSVSKPTAEQIALASQGWETNYAQAVQKATALGRPILVEFTADWCPPCQYMKYQVLTLPGIRQVMEDRFVALRADITSPTSAGVPLAQRYEIGPTPTYLVLDTQGNVLARQVGGLPEQELLAWLERVPSPGR